MYDGIGDTLEGAHCDGNCCLGARINVVGWVGRMVSGNSDVGMGYWGKLGRAEVVRNNDV